MTLLSIIQDATAEMGLPKPSQIFGNQNQQARQLLRAAQKEGLEQMRAVPWQAITLEHTFTTVAADIQTGSIPDDWDRFCNDSIYNRTSERKVWGPITGQEWQQRQAYSTASTIDYWFRLRGGSILITPQPPAGETIGYEYISTKWAKSSGGTAQTKFLADTDETYLYEDLVTLGVIWRWRKDRQLEWQSSFQEYTDQLTKRTGSQKGSPTLKMAPRPYAFNRVNVPEGNWG